MTDTHEAGIDTPDPEPEAAAPQQDTDTPPTDAEPEPHETADPEPAQPKNREERFRKQLRQVEGERDNLTERLDRLQRTEVERIASQHMADGADIWRDGAELTSVLTDDGDIDHDKVTELAAALVDSHKHWRRTSPASPPASVVTSNDKITSGPPPPSWTDVLRGKTK